MKILLFFPPFWDTQQPYLALPSLTAFLKKKQINVAQRDLNIEILDYILSPEYLGKAGVKAKRQLHLANKKRLSSLKKALSILPETISKVNQAKNYLRHKDKFFDIELFQQSKQLLQKALFIASIPYLPARLDLFGYYSPYSSLSCQNLSKATIDKKTNLFLEIYQEKIPQIIKEEKPDVVGISISGGYQIIPGLTLARFLKKHFPSVHITAGGNIFTRLSEALLKEKKFFSTFFDSVVLFEGEQPLFALIKALSCGKGLDCVPNLLYLKNSRIIKNQASPPPAINELPTPDFSGFDLSLYFTPTPVLPILASRGCYWGKCAFCDHGYTYRNYYGTRNINLLIRDIKFLKRRHKTQYFSFADESISPKQYRLISKALIEEGCNIYWLSESRFEEELSKGLGQKIYKSGGRLVYFGLESACQRVLSLMRKGTDLATIKKVLANISQSGIWNHAFAFFGFPTETLKEAQKTFDFVFTHKDIIDSVWSGVFWLGRWSAVKRTPRRFKISKLKGQEFSLVYDYKTQIGCSQKEAKKIWRKFTQELDKEYGCPVWRILNRAELLLYLGHYQGKNKVRQLCYQKEVSKSPFSIVYQ